MYACCFAFPRLESSLGVSSVLGLGFGGWGLGFRGLG